MHVLNHCRKSDPSIRKILEEAGGRDFRKLQSYFVSRVQQIVKSMSKKNIGLFRFL